MNLCQLNTFFLTFWPVCCGHTANWPKREEKSVQLEDVHLYQIYFLQNPYFKQIDFGKMFHRTCCIRLQWFFMLRLLKIVRTVQILIYKLLGLFNQGVYSNAGSNKASTVCTYLISRCCCNLKIRKLK